MRMKVSSKNTTILNPSFLMSFEDLVRDSIKIVVKSLRMDVFRLSWPSKVNGFNFKVVSSAIARRTKTVMS
jgi:hypothetical protein